MVKSAYFLTTSTKRINCHVVNGTNKAIFEIPQDLAENSFDIEIAFDQPIKDFRIHDYTWSPLDDLIAAEFCPKIIRLGNGQFVLPNKNIGIWEIQKNNPFVLLWRFNPKDSAPLTVYSGDENQKVIVNAERKFELENLGLLFTKEAIEFSRSPIPFSAVACFTDHCDYDTPDSLRLQRNFFASNSIKVTKGFFLNHYSKRKDNASFKNDSREIENWKLDNHELAYHSLSQSIKNHRESLEDFKNFLPPFADIATWIDHGYQPYNLSLFKKNKISER
ncbi:MAG TPA: hypothetical protein VGB43_02480, partial [Flavobacterium sp.]